MGRKEARSGISMRSMLDGLISYTTGPSLVAQRLQTTNAGKGRAMSANERTRCISQAHEDVQNALARLTHVSLPGLHGQAQLLNWQTLAIGLIACHLYRNFTLFLRYHWHDIHHPPLFADVLINSPEHLSLVSNSSRRGVTTANNTEIQAHMNRCP